MSARENRAARVIQRFMRAILLHALAIRVDEVGLTTTAITANMEFEAVPNYLRGEGLKALAKSFVRRLLYLATTLGHVARPEGFTWRPVYFLTAFMISCFPQNVFENIGILEQELLGASRAMLERFEAVRADILRDPFGPRNIRLLQAFAEAFFAFIASFNRWNPGDTERVIGRLRRALFEIIRAQMEDPTNGGLANNRERLSQYLRRLAGQQAIDEVIAAANASMVLPGLIPH